VKGYEIDERYEIGRGGGRDLIRLIRFFRTTTVEVQHEMRAPPTCPLRVGAYHQPHPVVRWVLERRPTTERSSVSEEDALRRAREELALLEAQRVQLSPDVMEGRPEALEEDERLRQRIVELGHWLMEA
jgi:hypothetical protein